MVVIIPMAGLGARFKAIGIDEPKPLIKVRNMTLIEHSVKTLDINGKYIFVTRRYEEEKYNNELTRILNRIAPDNIEICIESETKGSVDSCLKAVPFIKDNEPIIETNCDQHLEWNGKEFLNFVETTNCDGSVVTYESSDKKNSFALVANNKITKIVEKDNISADALVGVHYWKRAKDFISSSKKLLKITDKEAYISETYNFLIQEGKTILPYKIQPGGFKCLGTPEDVSNFNETI